MRDVSRTFIATEMIGTWKPVYVWTGEVSRFNVGELTDHGIVRTVLDQTRTWGDCSTDGEKTLSLYTILTLYLVARRTCSIDHSARYPGISEALYCTGAVPPYARSSVFRWKLWRGAERANPDGGTHSLTFGKYVK